MENKKTTIILFRGRPGVGKSTISDALAKKYNLPVLRKDDIYDSVTRYIEDHTARNEICYDSLFKIMKSNATSGTSIILDYPFQKEEDITNLLKWCAEQGLNLISVLVICSDRELWRSRFNTRSKNPAPNQLITDLDELERYYGNLNLKPLEGEIVTDTVEPIENILKHLATQVNLNNS